MLKTSVIVPQTLTQELCALGFAELKLSNSSQQKLWAYFENFVALWQAEPEMIKAVLGEESVYAKNWLERKSKINLNALKEKNDKLGVQVLPINHPQYPPLLKEIHHAPKVLFALGNTKALLMPKTLGIVGTREATPYGQTICEKLIQDLSPLAPIIISGLAEGIDTCAHHFALNNNCLTVAVFGTGLDTIFPSQNQNLAQKILENHGALVSEYPLGTRGDKYTFPNRNRIIAGLCEGTLVVEAPEKSGALITARIALEENRAVMAVCGNIFNKNSAGCHKLIKSNSAELITSAEDIIKTLHWEIQPNKKSKKTKPEKNTDTQLTTLPTLNLTPEEKQVYTKIGVEPIQLEQLLEKLPELYPHQLQQQLLMLEMKGAIISHPGNHYSLNI